MRFGLMKFIRAAKRSTKSSTKFLVMPLALLLLTACLSDKGNLDSQRNLANAGTGGAIGGRGSYTIGGTVFGLTGSLVLQNNGADNLAVLADGSFTFPSRIANSGKYNVTVLLQPTGQTCSVSTGMGIVSGNNVGNVAVVCASSSNSYKVGGTVSGLLAGGSVVLQDNNGDNLTVAANGAFNFATKVASASPYSVTVFTQPTGQNCSVVSGAGTMAQADISNVAITCAANSYTVGGNVSGLNGSVVLQNNAGDNLTVATNGAFNFATTVAFGNTYAVTILTQPTGQTCSVTSGSGTVAANVSNVGVSCTNNSYTVGGTVLGLKAATSVVLQNNGGGNLTVSADGTFTFAAPVLFGNTYNVTVLTQPTGQICSVGSGSGTMAAGNVAGVTVNCKGSVPSYAYVANNGAGENSIAQFTFGGGGSLAAMTPATVTTLGLPSGTTPTWVVVSPSGKYLYSANNGGSVSQFTIGATGALTPMAPATLATGVNTFSITVDPTGRYAYAVNMGSNTVSQFSINATTGALTPMTPATVATGASPSCITVDPSGRYAYVANWAGGASSSVSQYIIGATGALVPMTPATVAAGVGPYTVTVDPSGQHAYVANMSMGVSGTVSQFNIGANGALVPMTPATVVTGLGTNPLNVAIDPLNRYAYVALSVAGSVAQYTIGANGALTPMMTPTVPVAAGSVGFVHVDPSGQYAFVTNNNPSGTLSQYTIGAGGGLTPMATATVLTGGRAYGMTTSSAW